MRETEMALTPEEKVLKAIEDGTMSLEAFFANDAFNRFTMDPALLTRLIEIIPVSEALLATLQNGRVNEK